MIDKKSIYITSAVCSALALAATDASAQWNAEKKRCYGAALAGKNDCGGAGSGKATKNCDPTSYMTVSSEADCKLLMSYCKMIPEGSKKPTK